MFSNVAELRLPAWAAAEVESQCAERGVSAAEFVRYLVCAHVKAASPVAEAQFTVPHEMESAFVGEDFMVVRRDERGVVLTPCESMSFKDALAEFQANGCTEDDVLLAMERNNAPARHL